MQVRVNNKGLTSVLEGSLELGPCDRCFRLSRAHTNTRLGGHEGIGLLKAYFWGDALIWI